MIRWLFALCCLCVSQVWADEVDLLAPEEKIENVSSQTTEQATENLRVLPDCNDETLKEQVKIVISEYDARQKDTSLIAKRRQILQLRSLSEYSEENVSDFNSKKNRVVADTLIMTKINKGLVDNQVRLCKSQNEKDGFKPVYLLMYVNSDNLVNVMVLNYSETTEKLEFVM